MLTTRTPKRAPITHHIANVIDPEITNPHKAAATATTKSRTISSTSATTLHHPPKITNPRSPHTFQEFYPPHTIPFVLTKTLLLHSEKYLTIFYQKIKRGLCHNLTKIKKADHFNTSPIYYKTPTYTHLDHQAR